MALNKQINLRRRLPVVPQLGNPRMRHSDKRKPGISTLPSFNGGCVDAAGFLALAGLFTAHVTGNFVTLGASLMFGTSGAIGKLLALPVFCVVAALVRLIGSVLCGMQTRLCRSA